MSLRLPPILDFHAMIADGCRWLRVSLLLALPLAGAALVSIPQAAPPEQLPTLPPRQAEAREEKTSGPIYVGAGSCAAAACHGGPADAPRKWQSAYTIWTLRDRHAKAYSVLMNTRSKDIVRLLKGTDQPEPWKEDQCLACHSSPGRTNEWRDAFVADGVSCEACHGAASNWLPRHTLAGWKKLGDDRFKTFGMVNTKDMVFRAEACLDCHVGNVHPKSGEQREVTHELIAAGHPRLTFEFSAYLANMPPHWDVTPASAVNDDARAWAVGQVTAARTTFQLRADHAERKGLEFSDYDCFACHHELRGESWRRAGYGKRDEARERAGAPRYATWNTSMLESLEQLAAGELKRIDSARGNSSLQALAKHADDDAFHKAAQAGDQWASALDGASLRQAMAQVAKRGAGTLHWDDATQCYLALLALDNSCRSAAKMRGGALNKTDRQIHEAIKALYDALDFPNMCRDERGRVMFEPDPDPDRKAPPSPGTIARLDSPAIYDPKQVQGKFKALAELLGTEEAQAGQ